ncbi:MAG TPA: hypothetical protein VNN79_23090, partial [Actinomycetota bacterium]|nr:hypothetical protein [Actinomycetota bacterium]
GNGVILQDDGTTGNAVQGNFIGTDATGGAALGNGLNGVSLLASGNTIGGATAGAGNVLSANARGIAGADLSSGLIAGNRIGTTASGAAALGNSDVGVRLDDSTGVTVGGSVPAARNVISGNGGNGLELNGGGQHLVRGNRIGTNAAGTAALPNAGNGIDVAGSAGNRVGGGAKTRNLISGNAVAGVFVHDPGSTGNRIASNFIGTDAKGTAALGNAKAGVQILDASGNTVGGPTKPAGNRIEFNRGRGIVIDDPDDPATENALRRNLLFHNGALGIDLGADGPDANDAHDADAGPNGHQNFPVIHLASTAHGRTEIHLTLSSTAKTAFVVELFSNTACDPSGFGEGQAFVVSKTITTDASGAATLAFSRFPAVPVGRFLTATATDPNGNTSELSRCLRVTDG